MEITTPLRNRDFRLLWAGQSISHVGSGVTQVALAWQALQLSRGAGGLALVLTARSIPLVALSLVGGAVTDRISRRRIMLASDVLRGITVAAVAVLAATGVIRLWSLVGLAAVFGAAEAFFFPASTAIIPELVGGSDLVRANALESFARPLTMHMAGPALGGLLVAVFGTSVAFGFDAVTFAASAACLIAIRARGAPPSERTGLVREIVDGFRYTRRQPWIWATLLMALAAVLCFMGPFQVLGPIVAKTRLGAGAGGYGLMVAAMGIGGIAGALAAPRLARGRRVARLYVAWGVGVLLFAVIGVTRSLPVAAAAAAVLGFGFEVGSIIWVTLLQELVPARLLGRVRSLDFMVSFALMPVSYAITAPITSAIGLTPTIVGASVAASAVRLHAVARRPGSGPSRLRARSRLRQPGL